MPRSALPFGSEFSPAKVDLAVLLELACQHGADWKAFEHAVRNCYFAEHKTSDYNKDKLANNTKLSLRAYGLVSYPTTSSASLLPPTASTSTRRTCQSRFFTRYRMLDISNSNAAQRRLGAVPSPSWSLPPAS